MLFFESPFDEIPDSKKIKKRVRHFAGRAESSTDGLTV